MADTVRDVLHEFGDVITEAQAASILRESLKHVVETGSAPASAEQIELALRYSGLPSSDRRGVRASLASPARSAVVRQEIAVSSASWVLRSRPAKDVMELLDLSRSGLSRRVTEGRLYAVGTGATRSFPDWQFCPTSATGTLPHLETIIPALDGIHPATIAAAMTLQQEITDGRTPIEWLAAGGDPQPVLDLLTGLRLW